jgi:hypothetical protein
MTVGAVNRGNVGYLPGHYSPQGSSATSNPVQFHSIAAEGGDEARSLKSWGWEKIQKIGKGILEGVYVAFISNGILMNINNAVKEFFRHSEVIQSVTESLNKVFEVVDFAEILLVPIALSNIAHDIYGLVKGEISVADFILSFGENLGFIALSIIELLKLLVKLSVIPLQALKYLTPFSLIKVVLDGINIIASAKGLVENYRFAKEMKSRLEAKRGVWGNDVKDYRKVFQYISNENAVSNQEVSKFFGVEAASLRKRIQDVVIPALEICEKKDSTVEEKMRAEMFLKDAYKGLKGRVKANIVSHKLGLTTASISAVVHSALFASPFIIAACPVAAPILPTLFAISGANACISLSKFIYDTVKQQQFQKSVLFDDTLVVARKAKQTISAGSFANIAAN